MNEQLRRLAEAQQEFVVDIRRVLHQIPEVRWEETQTLKAICTYVLGSTPSGGDTEIYMYDHLDGGIVVDVNFPGCTDRILFRADVDGLPIAEATGLDFASTNGMMHACGHDFHPAMLLGAFRAIMSSAVVRPTRNLRLVFQRAEENPITPSG